MLRRGSRGRKKTYSCFRLYHITGYIYEYPLPKKQVIHTGFDLGGKDPPPETPDVTDGAQ
jgi:hypothetical protein